MNNIGLPRQYRNACLSGVAGLLLLTALFSGAVCADETASEHGGAAVQPYAAAHHGHGSTDGHHRRVGAFGQPLHHCQSILADLAGAAALPSPSGSGDPTPAAITLWTVAGAGAIATAPGASLDRRRVPAWQSPPLILTTARLRL